jgi:hypothetical protein
MNKGHNIEFEEQAHEHVRTRNKKLLEAYNSIILSIDKIQGWLEDEYLRTRIESEMMSKPNIKSTIYQCTTPWCIISLGCDSEGRYNIVYSVDHRIQEMIGDRASGLLRSIYYLTPGELSVFLRIGCLYEDCVKCFNHLYEEQKSEPFHKIITKSKHDYST